jgi:enamine deaminase RidA (YjgF/YER057c/UK114 family)
MGVKERLLARGVVLPPPPAPIASYVPVVRSGTLLFVSGQGPMVDGVPVVRGRIGAEVDVAQGVEAARLAAINAVAALAGAVGDLDSITRIVKLTGYVASAEGFGQQHLVVNGASDLLAEAFGERGCHARAAVGTNSLPLGIPVEIELVAEAPV